MKEFSKFCSNLANVKETKHLENPNNVIYTPLLRQEWYRNLGWTMVFETGQIIQVE